MTEQPAIRDTANSYCRELLDVLSAHGVRTFVLSPGSRNAPLLIGVAARQEIKRHVIADERTAAFTALGIAIVSQEPVALVCTSGTALYNYAPAVAEAFHQHIPLIVISADRPMQWIGQDDSQTLAQPGALDSIVKKSFDIPPESPHQPLGGGRRFESERIWYVNRIANEAAITAVSGIKGPVHINVQLDTPLDRTVPYAQGEPRIVRFIDSERALDAKTLDETVRHMQGKRVLIVAGFMQPDSKLGTAIRDFVTESGAFLLAESLSNLHLDQLCSPIHIDTVLKEMSAEDRRRLRPDIVISIGGALVSRMLKEWLRDCEGTEHWTLGDTACCTDCFMRLERHFNVSPAVFFRRAAGFTRKIRSGRKCDTGYYDEWSELRLNIFDNNTMRIDDAPWSELRAFDIMLRNIRQDLNLFLSNGTPVRYAQLVLNRMPHACYCNRGVSGIDGTSATALGAALAYGRTTLLVSGDLSFSYCPEVLALAPRLGADLRIVVINNSGGGIFRFVKSTRDLSVREELFCANPKLPLEGLASAYGWKYMKADSAESLKTYYRKLLDTPLSLLEIEVDPEQSARVLRDFMEIPSQQLKSKNTALPD